MESLKKIIKKIVPPWIWDVYETVKLIPRFLCAEKQERKNSMIPVSFYTDQKTVDLILNHRMSLSRFGDGEFRWMLEKTERSFQQCSAQLAEELTKTFQNNNPNLLIGIPVGLFESAGCKPYVKLWWKIVKWEIFSKIIPYVDYSKTYCNASITRPYIDYMDREWSRKSFENIRRIWDGRDCIFVEGEKTKLGVGNDLFDNARSIGRILCPAENAFEKIDEIKTAIREYAHRDSLILGALGPTASILAAHMCAEGYQFVDIGHIDIEYIWFLKKAKRREPIPGKYVNECGCQLLSDDHEDAVYRSSILKIIR